MLMKVKYMFMKVHAHESISHEVNDCCNGQVSDEDVETKDQNDNDETRHTVWEYGD